MKRPDVSRIKGKGEPTCFVGATGQGKSSVINSLIDDENVVELAGMRLAHGKGTVAVTHIIYTNYPAIPKGVIVLTGEFKHISEKDIYDDNELITEVLYYAAKDYNYAINKNNKDPNVAFQEGVSKAYLDKLNNYNDNTSLPYRLRDIYVNELRDIINATLQFNPEILNKMFVEMKMKGNANSSGEIESFKELLIEYSKTIIEIKNALNSFWKTIADIFNKQCTKYLYDIDEYNRERNYECDENRNDGDRKFEIVIGIQDKDEEIVQELLNSEKRTKEFLIDDYTIYINIDFDKFNNDLNYYHVLTENDKKYYVIHLIDTMGLFHGDGVRIREEKERIIDTFMQYHSANVVFVVKAEEDALTKASIEAFSDFVRNSKKEINIYIAYTHLDKHIANMMKNKSNQYIRSTDTPKNELVNKALNDINNKFEDLNDSFKLQERDGKKPKVIDKHLFSLWTYDNEIDDQIDSFGYSYIKASINLINEIAYNNQLEKFRVHNMPEHPYTLSINEMDLYGVKDIYTNIVFNKELCHTPNMSVHWKTSQSAINDWKNSGIKFTSNARGQDTGYCKIETYFVEYIKNFVNTKIVKSIDFITENWVEEHDDIDRCFDGELRKYLADNLGRKVVMHIGDMLFNSTQFSYYGSEMLEEMISMLQYNFFMYPEIKIKSIDPLFLSIDYCINIAIEEFVNYRCIEVY